MANGKKSFIAYTDWKDTFDALPDDKAGQLIKHLFAYVCDENPETDDILLKVAFAGIKQTLKRDLKKWEGYIEKQRVNGAKGGRPKNPTLSKKTQAFFEKPKKADSVSVSVSVNDNVNDDDITTVIEFCRIVSNDNEYLDSFTIPPGNYIKSLINLKNGQSNFSRHCQQQGKGARSVREQKSHLTNYAIKRWQNLSPATKLKYQ